MKYLTKEVKIALMAIVAIVILFIGINFLKGINIFTSSNTYYVKFHDINGLAVSNAVYANGYPVGIVRSIDYDYQRTDNVVVGIELDKAMNVPRGTVAELESELMGGVKMSLVLGPNPTQNLTPGDTLIGGMHQGSLNKLEAMIPTIETLLPKLDSILAHLNALTADPALAQTLHNTAELTGNLKEASAGMADMMRDDVPALLNKFNKIGSHAEKLSENLAAADINGTLQQVNTTLRGVQQTTGSLTATTDFLHRQLNSTDNTLGLFLNDRGVYDHLNSTMEHADSLVTDLKAHPKRYVHFSVFGGKSK
jgi:phospholipid/cholesterol/gamma-HCH transport system substrate-binding protein